MSVISLKASALLGAASLAATIPVLAYAQPDAAAASSSQAPGANGGASAQVKITTVGGAAQSHHRSGKRRVAVAPVAPAPAGTKHIRRVVKVPPGTRAIVIDADVRSDSNAAPAAAAVEQPRDLPPPPVPVNFFRLRADQTLDNQLAIQNLTPKQVRDVATSGCGNIFKHMTRYTAQDTVANAGIQLNGQLIEGHDKDGNVVPVLLANGPTQVVSNETSSPQGCQGLSGAILDASGRISEIVFGAVGLSYTALAANATADFYASAKIRLNGGGPIFGGITEYNNCANVSVNQSHVGGNVNANCTYQSNLNDSTTGQGNNTSNTGNTTSGNENTGVQKVGEATFKAEYRWGRGGFMAPNLG